MSQLELANFKADFDNFGPGTLTWEVFDPTKSTPFIRREKIRELYNTHLGGLLLSSPIEEVDGGLV